MNTASLMAACLLTSVAVPTPSSHATLQTSSGKDADINALTPASPLDPLPTVHGPPRPIALPGPPHGPIPDTVILPPGEGGGAITLLAPWPGGWLVGTDGGEWIGSLYLVRASRKVVLAKGNVLGGFTWCGHLYILSGLQHLGLDEGELWEIDLRGERLVRRIRLPAMPEQALLTEDQHLVVRTGKGEIRLSSNGAIARSDIVPERSQSR
nr:hypothetical protein [uncultured Sphingomonas sp.]